MFKTTKIIAVLLCTLCAFSNAGKRAHQISIRQETETYQSKRRDELDIQMKFDPASNKHFYDLQLQRGLILIDFHNQIVDPGKQQSVHEMLVDAMHKLSSMILRDTLNEKMNRFNKPQDARFTLFACELPVGPLTICVVSVIEKPPYFREHLHDSNIIEIKDKTDRKIVIAEFGSLEPAQKDMLFLELMKVAEHLNEPTEAMEIEDVDVI